ncbi:DUF2179 domain-containing protein [Patescibacteria group bacterium]|nr:DUF2179 domain-containing protein [Patescibacteria group bacterium]
MQELFVFDSALAQYMILPLFIFVAKVFEVSIGTIRLILLARREKQLVPYVAFVEVLIWIITIGIIFSNLTNMMAYVAYALGFAVGNRLGMSIEERMAIGNSMIRVITRRRAQKLIKYLKKEKYPITTIAAKSNNHDVNLVYILTRRKNLKPLIRQIKKYNPRAFFSVEDVSVVNEGIMPLRSAVIPKTPISKRLWGKSK